ncbi:MAG: hypothetical protein ACD_24C00472G0001 [uncultured bacterium]|nr:MAG: hypothetical protein ACD_24C00472G0001 [uncultured bacterium]KKP68068.1 MAG: hypothetical protein UR65_C0063G0002 [Candidatus Moranbacteria bacterium GW2011_GWE2_35_164]KKP81901.1 MAG: hypothetical protein UR83_C0063G0003 [Candidatus Moranbacteria bacterium GW2011_GWF2_35_54]HBR79791.1 hypothetical protein [Candidatus Moranbacteria bacterium]
MQNKKISTAIGTIVILIVAVTVGMLVWKIEKNQPIVEQPQKIVNIKKQETPPEINKQNNQNVPEGEEFPSILAEPNMSMEDIVKQLIFKRSPEWEIKNYSISVTVETNQENHAIGRFIYDNNKKEHHNTAEGIWFAAKEDQSWTLVGTSYTGYWGICQDFKKYKFPTNMIPDCWDIEKNILIDTTNTIKFYTSGFTKSDKTEIIKSFLDHYKKTYQGSEGRDFYLNKDLYLKIDKSTDKYFKGRILIGGIENHSTPYTLAVKENEQWKILLQSQDIPLCSIVEPYKFPSEIVDKCYDEINKKEKDIN